MYIIYIYTYSKGNRGNSLKNQVVIAVVNTIRNRFPFRIPFSTKCVFLPFLLRPHSSSYPSSDNPHHLHRFKHTHIYLFIYLGIVVVVFYLGYILLRCINELGATPNDGRKIHRIDQLHAFLNDSQTPHVRIGTVHNNT